MKLEIDDILKVIDKRREELNQQGMSVDQRTRLDELFLISVAIHSQAIEQAKKENVML